LELRDSYDLYVRRILILGNTRGEEIAQLRNFRDQVIAVEEKLSGAVEPTNPTSRIRQLKKNITVVSSCKSKRLGDVIRRKVAVVE
jgi:hypothetical protein